MIIEELRNTILHSINLNKNFNLDNIAFAINIDGIFYNNIIYECDILTRTLTFKMFDNDTEYTDDNCSEVLKHIFHARTKNVSFVKIDLANTAEISLINIADAYFVIARHDDNLYGILNLVTNEYKLKKDISKETKLEKPQQKNTVKVLAIWEFEVDISDFDPKHVNIQKLAVDLTKKELQHNIDSKGIDVEDFRYTIEL